jgi:2-phosphoglycerate kinase
MSNLSNVLWIGGAPCAGKSTIAAMLGKQYGLEVYHVDEAFSRHATHFTPSKQPCLYKWTHTSWNDLWLQSNEQLLEEAIGCYSEHFELAIEDLKAKPKFKGIIAEGNVFMPDRVINFLTHPNQAIWLIPTKKFLFDTYRSKRSGMVEGILRTCDHPEQAYLNWMNRDANFSEWVEQRARIASLQVLRVSGEQSIKDTAQRVASHFRL